MDITNTETRAAFAPLVQEHRRELVATVEGVRFINDSMACTPLAAWYTLEEMPDASVHWLVGGEGDATDWMQLVQVAGKKVKRLYDISTPFSSSIVRTFTRVVPEHCWMPDGMEQAVHIAAAFAEEGDVVLLSPACASYDRFTNYEERGRAFKNAVRGL